MQTKKLTQNSFTRPLSSAAPNRGRSNERNKRVITPTPVTMSNNSSITREIDDPTPDVGTWRRNLRSPSPSTRLKLSPQMSRKNELSKTTDSFDFSRFRENLDRSLNDTSELEEEYVKSLKSQINILEMDNSYLRDRGLKISEMYPAMKMEAEAMLGKLKEMQARSESLDLEIFRKKADVDRLTKVNDHLVANMKSDMDFQLQEKQKLMEEAVALKRDKDACERELAKGDVVLEEIKSDHTTTLSNLRSAETKVESLKIDLNSQVNVTDNLERAVLDVREKLADANSNLLHAEKKAITAVPPPEVEKEQIQLKQEILDLRARLASVNNETQTTFANKEELSADVMRMTKENIAMSQLVSQMRVDIEKVRELRGSEETRRSEEILNVTHLNNRVKELQAENARLADNLQTLKGRNTHALTSIKSFDDIAASTARESSFAHTRLRDLEYSSRSLTEENTRLKREKNYLIDQVEAVQLKLQERNNESLGLDTHIMSLSKRSEELERLAKMEQSVQSQRWAELARMADDVRGYASRGPQQDGDYATPYNPDRYK